jgi:Tol biopolymer transport system component
MSLTPGRRIGPYEIVNLVGAGGMGEVYRARDTRLDRTVAVKVLTDRAADDPGRRERFQREARAVASLSHPSICALYDVGHDDGVDFLVMEFLEGETLDRRLARGPMPLDETLRNGAALADALHHAHQRGFVHRDVKPANVMLTPTGPKLLDFGLAKWRSRGVFGDGAGEMSAQTTEVREFTHEGAIIGTLQYMAPEQLEGKDADARSDVFGLGLVLYEMATGRKAFAGESHASLIAAIFSSEPPPASTLDPKVPEALDHVVARCLAKDADERWQSARDIARELEWIRSGGQGKTGGRGGTAPPSRYRRAGWIAAGVLLAIATGLTVFLAMVLSRDRAARPTAVRLSLPAPADVTFFPSGHFMALSPDGLHLAYVASTADRTRFLWVQRLSDLTARKLPGTNDATQPFWSFDSRFIVFTADGKLKKVALDGGLPQELCPAHTGFAGSWNRNGIILFGPAPGEPIFSVPASGGTPVAVTTLDKSQLELAHGSPEFLPDGQHFIYLAISSRPESTGVYLTALGSSSRKLLLNVQSNAVFVQPGYLLFVREGVLLAQRFDVNRLALVGDAAPLARSIVTNPNTAIGSFTASDTGILAYKTAANTELTWFDRTGTRLSTIGPAGRVTEPALSPDGARVVVTRLDPETGTPDIWLIDSATGEARQFTFDAASEMRPVWSPDGGVIAFVSNRNGTFNVFGKPSSGSGPDQSLFQSDWETMLQTWSLHAGLVFASMKQSHDRFSLFRLPPGDAQEPVMLVESATSGQVSPDGRWLAYRSNADVYVQSAEHADAKWQISEGGGIEPKWCCNGRELFYLAQDGRLMAVSVTGGSTWANQTPHALFKTHAADMPTPIIGRNQYDVTADGQRFLIVQERPDSPITVVVNWPDLLAPSRAGGK